MGCDFSKIRIINNVLKVVANSSISDFVSTVFVIFFANKVKDFTRDRSGQLGYNILSKKNKGKLEVDVLKTLVSNAKALTPLAMKGLTFLSSLPAATVTMFLQSTPANSDEMNMKLEDFAKLNEGSTNIDKAIYND